MSFVLSHWSYVVGDINILVDLLCPSVGIGAILVKVFLGYFDSDQTGLSRGLQINIL